SGALAQLLPPLLKAGQHHDPQADQTVTYLYMQDDYARAHNASDFITFSATLRLLYTTFGAFEPTADGKKLLQELNRYHVAVRRDSSNQNRPMGDFFRDAAAKLIDYDP